MPNEMTPGLLTLLAQTTADLLRENAELKKFAEGLELNLAAVIQRAEAAEKALASMTASRDLWEANANEWKRTSGEFEARLTETVKGSARMLGCAEDWAAIKGKLEEEKAS